MVNLQIPIRGKVSQYGKVFFSREKPDLPNMEESCKLFRLWWDKSFWQRTETQGSEEGHFEWPPQMFILFILIIQTNLSTYLQQWGLSSKNSQYKYIVWCALVK